MSPAGPVRYEVSRTNNSTAKCARRAAYAHTTQGAQTTLAAAAAAAERGSRLFAVDRRGDFKSLVHRNTDTPRPARTGRVGFRLASGVAPWGDLRQALLLDCVLLACFVALGLGFTTRVTRQWSDNLALQPNDTEKLAPRHCRCEFASRPGRWTILRLEILKGDLLLRNMSRTAELQE